MPATERVRFPTALSLLHLLLDLASVIITLYAHGVSLSVFLWMTNCCFLCTPEQAAVCCTLLMGRRQE